MRLFLWLAGTGLAVSGCGGGGGSAGTSIDPTSAPQGTVTPTPTLMQKNSFQTLDVAGDGNTAVQFTSVTKAGDTIWVAATVSDIIASYTLSVTDTQGNTYTQLLPQQNDGAPGYQTVAQFYAANIAGDATTPDTITIAWPTDNYKGVVIAEISGTTTAPLVGSGQNTQDGLGAGTGNVTSGAIDVASAQTPALLIALSMNTSGGTSDTGGSGAGGPAAGPGMTPVAVLWDWGGNLATLVTAPITSAESASAVFNAPDVDDYVTVAAAFH